MLFLDGTNLMWDTRVIAIAPTATADDLKKLGQIVAVANTVLGAFNKVPGFKPPNLSNATPAFLADTLGQTKKRTKVLKQIEGFFKEALKARMDVGKEEKGEYYTARLSNKSRSGISKDLLTKKYPEVAADPEIYSTTHFQQMDTKANTEQEYASDDWMDLEE